MRALEFATLFGVVPTVFAFARHRLPAIPSLWLLTAYCLAMLLRDPSFNRAYLWNSGSFWQYAPGIFALFSLAVIAIGAAVYRFAPHKFLSLIKTNPRFWALIMLLYPVLSVYPQGIVYRAFVFQRYRGLFGGGLLLVLASASAFSYVHIIFKNPIAIGLTFLGGIIFAARYWQSGSLFTSSFEHALYGCFMFTVGLGRSFYHAASRDSVNAADGTASPLRPPLSIS